LFLPDMPSRHPHGSGRLDGGPGVQLESKSYFPCVGISAVWLFNDRRTPDLLDCRRVGAAAVVERAAICGLDRARRFRGALPCLRRAPLRVLDWVLDAAVSGDGAIPMGLLAPLDAPHVCGAPSGGAALVVFWSPFNRCRFRHEYV